MLEYNSPLPELTDAEAVRALDTCAGRVLENLPQFTYACQNHSSVNLVYPPCRNDQWTCGFWPGELWLTFEHTRDYVFKYAGLIQSESFLRRIEQKIAVDHHDMGFLYTPSCVAAYKLTGDKRSRTAAVLAADQLLTRFQQKGEFFQAWGKMGVKENYRFIIDCLLNLPLLYWASEVTGKSVYHDTALRHTATCIKYSFRSDGSTYHTYFMEPATGQGSHGATCQGYKDDSAWARGQAWAIYGLALSYRYTGDTACIELFRKAADFFLDRLPADMVPYWDMIFADGSDEPRDSSSASITACGLLEMAPHLQKTEGELCVRIARQILKSLTDGYLAASLPDSNGLVLHATYSKKSPYNTCTPEGVDECVGWGDYFYYEALTRLCRVWEPYW